ncbi:contractile injection system tape measure protein [Halioxenophilus sp. WMMB6]|uniref:contractile injection system tape measure protein n=1 Tax=Halioxenophilus sp. WMMB6 TaxID=3073815 RepID=UPI00295F3313|nr:contractile injection system tape measure protein [Halioxenophilus sp. WMMB6]
MQNNHRIKRLRLNASAGHEEAALALRRQINEQWSQLLPTFNSVLDEIAGPENFLHIPRLELQLTDLQAERLLPQLRRELAELISKQTAANVYPGSEANLQSGDATQNSGADSASPDNAEALNTEAIGWLKHYLLTGSLPWYALTLNEPFTVLQKIAVSANTELHILLNQQLTHTLLLRWLQLLPPSVLDDQISALLAALPQPSSHSHYRRALKMLIDGVLISHTVRQQQHWLAFLIVQASGACAGNTAHASVHTADLALNSSQQKQWQQQLMAAGFSVAQLAEILALATADTLSKPATTGVQSLSTSGNSRSPAAEAKLNHTTLRLLYGGTILIYPYLRRLFDACGVRHNKAGIQPSDYKRALALIFFAATGREVALAFELNIAHLLLGDPNQMRYPVENALASHNHTEQQDQQPEGGGLIGEGLLTSDDKSEVATLLAAMIRHWSRLKNTSPTGLQTAFLQRSALLSQHDGVLQLTFERLGHDILLDYLPYSITTVKLPWMTKPLFITW